MTTTPSLLLRALLTTRIRLVILLALCITAAGLLVPQPAHAAAPTAAPASAAALLDPECESDPALCTPPPMLNKQLLQDPSSVYRATSAQQAAIAALEDEALVNALADYQLPASEADAMSSWGRQEVLAQLWALMIKAIRTEPGSRSADQAHVVTWLALMMNRKAEELAHNAGWEFLKWAGRASASQPRPPAADVLSDLRGFADGSLVPVTYMFGTAANSDSGYCDYLPPAGLEGEYNGNASRPHNNAGAHCFPPYQCTNPSGCETNQPAYESFLKWGEADATGNWQTDAPGNPRADDDFRSIAKDVSRDLIYASVNTAFGFETKLEIGMGVAAAATVVPFVAVAFANIAASTANMAVMTAKAAVAAGTGTAEAIGLAEGAAAAAASVSAAATAIAVFAAVIVAITIAVLKGIVVAQQAATPGKLRDVLANALDGVQNLQPMLTDGSDLTGLFSLFIRATGPIPRDTTCDNDQFVIGGPVVVPCANLTPVPAASLRDMEFKIQPLDSAGQPSGPPARSDTVTWVDALSPQALVEDDAYLTHQARLSDHWLVMQTTVPRSAEVPDAVITDEYLSHSMPAIWFPEPNGDRFDGTISWLRRQPDGGYRFLTAMSSWFKPNLPQVDVPINPDTCLAEGTCRLSDTVELLQPGPEGVDLDKRVEVSIVPALRAGIAVSHSADPQVGEPVTLTATQTGPDVGPLTYRWYVQPASGVIPVCGPTVRFCGYDGPFSGSQIEYTWQGSGTFKAVSVVTTEQGRETVTERSVVVDSTGPVLSIGSFGQTPFTTPYEPAGHIEHAGVTDVLTLTVDWGDGSEVTRSTYTPGQGSICATLPCPVFSVASPTRLDFTLKHSYAGPGSYEVTATVQDGAGRLDRRIFNHPVDKGQQAISFARPFDVRSIGEPAYETYADGGGAQTPVVVASTSPSVCEVSEASPGRVEGHARTTFTVTLVGMGFCALTADQDGDERYVAASQVLGFVEVVGQPQTLDFAALADRTYGDDPFVVSAIGGPSSAPVELTSTTPNVCAVSGLVPGRDSEDRGTASATVTLLRAGSCTIKASQAGDVGYLAAAPVERTFDVAYAAQSIDFAPLVDRTIGGPQFFVSATGGRSSAAVVLTSSTPGVCTVSAPTVTRVDGLARGSATVTLVAVGTCTIRAEHEGDDRYRPAEPVSRSFTVLQKAAQTLDFPVIAGRTFGDAPFEVTVTGGASTALVLLVSATPGVCSLSDVTSPRVDGLARTTATVTLLAAGTCTLRATQAGDANTLAAPAATQSFDVGRAFQPMTFPEIADRTFGSAPFTITVTGGPAAGQVALASLNPSVCTLSGATSTRVGGLARTTVTVKIISAGPCAIAAAQAGDANRWPGAAVRLFTVAKAPLSITAVNKTMTWRGSVPAYTVTYAGFVNGNTASVVTGLSCTARNSAGVVASSTSPVGPYPISCSGATAENYDITYVSGLLQVLYGFTGFTGLSSTNLNSLRAGSALSLKWVLKDANGGFVTTSSSFTSVKAAPMTCGGTIPTGGGTNVGPGVSGLTYTSSTGTWTYNWQTPTNLAGTCQAVTVHLADGSARTIRLRLTT